MVNNTRIGTRKSDFTGSTTIPSGSFFDFVINGQNLRISDTDFFAALGVTGTIVQGGDPAGSPVLDPQGSINVIRNIVGGFGITATVDPQNSITLATDFSFDETGEAIVDDPLASAPVFKSLVAGSDINIVSAAGILTFSANTDGLKAQNRIYINQATDFPAAVAGVITLVVDTEYYIGAKLTVTARFNLSAGNIVVRGQRPVSGLTYTGTGDMFTGVDAGSILIDGLLISQPSAASGDAIFNFSDSGAPLSVINLSNYQVASGDTLLKFQNLLAITNIFNNSTLTGNGIIAQGTGTVLLSIEKTAFNTSSATFVGVDLGTNVFTALEIMNCLLFGVAGTVGIKGLAASGNVIGGQVAAIESCEFVGGVTPLDTILFSDFRYSFSANSGIADTRPDGLASLVANATNTVISASSTPVKIAGTWVVELSSHFTVDTTGRITYNGEREVTLPIDIRAALEPVSGTNKDLTICIAINGTAINASCAPSRIDSGNPLSLTPIWQHTFVNGDFIEGFVSNETDTVDILVSSAVIRIR